MRRTFDAAPNLAKQLVTPAATLCARLGLLRRSCSLADAGRSHVPLVLQRLAQTTTLLATPLPPPSLACATTPYDPSVSSSIFHPLHIIRCRFFRARRFLFSLPESPLLRQSCRSLRSLFVSLCSLACFLCSLACFLLLSQGHVPERSDLPAGRTTPSHRGKAWCFWCLVPSERVHPAPCGATR